MLNVCIIGIGNAGGQIAELGKKLRDIPGIAINSSENDLSNVVSIPKIIIGDQKGAGKSRNEAKTFMKEHIKELINDHVFKSLIEENEVIFLASSIGGGTGSGMTPVLTNVLSQMCPDKIFVLIQVYPTLKESIASQDNATEYLTEVRKFLPNISYMPYDNNRRANIPTTEMMEDVNLNIIEDICVLRGDYNYMTPYNSIDEKDMLRIISTPGRLSVNRLFGIKEKDLDEKSIEELIINDLKNKSVIVEIDRDKILKRMGLITNLNEKLNKSFDVNVSQLKEFIGEPVEGFEHIHVNKEPDEINRVIIVMAGMSIPDDRIEKIIQRIAEMKAELTKTKGSSVLDSLEETSYVEDIRGTNSKPISDTEINLDSIFDTFIKK